MRLVVANFSRGNFPLPDDPCAFWSRQSFGRAPQPGTVRDFREWGFHLFATPVRYRELHPGCRVEFWEDRPERGMYWNPLGILKMAFLGILDALGYLAAWGPPDLFINYGSGGARLLKVLEGRCFRVHIPCAPVRGPMLPAEAYLVDRVEDIGPRARLYIPPVNDYLFRPLGLPTERDFVYLAGPQPNKRHDLVLQAMQGSSLKGHLHPVPAGKLDLSGTSITTSDWGEVDVERLLATSRVAIYAGDATSNPASTWECVAAGLPVVVNRELVGGRHVVVPGVTGELISMDQLVGAVQRVLKGRASYRPREHHQAHWQSTVLADGYLSWFGELGWPLC